MACYYIHLLIKLLKNCNYSFSSPGRPTQAPACVTQMRAIQRAASLALVSFQAEGPSFPMCLGAFVSLSLDGHLPSGKGERTEQKLAMRKGNLTLTSPHHQGLFWREGTLLLRKLSRCYSDFSSRKLGFFCLFLSLWIVHITDPCISHENKAVLSITEKPPFSPSLPCLWLLHLPSLFSGKSFKRNHTECNLVRLTFYFKVFLMRI